MEKKPQIIRVETIARTRLFRVEQIDLRFANGHERRYERLCPTGGEAVLVIPVLNRDTVLLIREYAAGVDRYELYLPKGWIDEGESIQEAANRELKEEVGYGATQLQHIKSFTLSPGYVDHTTHIMLARDLYRDKRAGDEPEMIEVVPWSLHKLADLLARDDCTEARSIAALFMARDYLVAQP